MQTIWGIDLGPTSVGFAVVDYDEKRESGRVHRLGVRIFPEGRTEDKQEPRNKARRAARLMRRQHRRKRLRRRLLREALAEAGLLPAFGSPDWFALMEPKRTEQNDPYALRARALGEPLRLVELGRALYHLSKRRGFFSPRIQVDEKADAEKKKEEGIVKEEIAKIAADLAGRTLGQMLAGVPEGTRGRRGIHGERRMTGDEFERIWAAQAAHHPKVLTDTLKKRVFGIVFRQRPVFWRLGTLGTCALEPDAPLCPKGSWIGQRYDVLSKVNGLRIALGNNPPLDAAQRATLLALIADAEAKGKRSVTFPEIRKALGLGRTIKFNFEVGGDRHLPCNATEAELAKALGARWASLPARAALRREIFECRFEIDYRRIGDKRVEIRDAKDAEIQKAAFVARAMKDWDVTETEAGALAEIDLPTGWRRHSTEAIEKLLPHLENAKLYSEAMDAAYPNWRVREGKVHERLPVDTREVVADTRNPTVHRTLNELRKVVNNLIAVHGKPDLIRVELARDLALPAMDRERMNRTNRERAGLRKKAETDLKDKGIASPSGEDVEKWLLWTESGKKCPYTGDQIGFDDLFRNGRFQIEHIFPLSKTLDNGFANKTLCRTDINEAKGDRSPFEYFSSLGGAAWDEAKSRTIGILAGNEAKARRFCREVYGNLEDEKTNERLIRDTAYGARMARDYLRSLFPPDPDTSRHVETTKGSLTAPLRRHWGLNALLATDGNAKKNRDDHRHHAVDALVVALTSRAFVKRLSDASRKQAMVEKRLIAPPWATLREDARRAVGRIVVSHKVRRKVSGPLHKQTSYGDTGVRLEDGRKNYALYVARKTVATLTVAQAKDIRDSRIRELALGRLAEHGGDAKKAFATPLLLPARDGKPPATPIKRVRVLVKQQPNLMVELKAANKSFADIGDNNHMAIYRDAAGDILYETVSISEATGRKAKGEPIVRRVHPTGATFVMSLSPGDMLEFVEPTGEIKYRVVSGVWAAGPIVLIDHTVADGTVWKRPGAKSVLELGAKKVSVDPIGRVRPAGD
jgi:CRISPR-associated endonuclease Csn1